MNIQKLNKEESHALAPLSFFISWILKSRGFYNNNKFEVRFWTLDSLLNEAWRVALLFCENKIQYF